MQLNKSIAFINTLIQQTKERRISWMPLNYTNFRHLFPQLVSDVSFCCETMNAKIAIGYRSAQSLADDIKLDIFICIEDSIAYSLFDDTEIADAQDDDFFCSKIYRLYNLVSSSGNPIEKFIDDYLHHKNQ